MIAKTKVVAISKARLLISLCFLLAMQGCKLLGSDGDKPTDQGSTQRGNFRIVSPIAGDALNLDSLHTILWVPSDSVVSSRVNISIFKDEKFLLQLTTNGVNSGTYPWRPSTINAGYKLGSGSGYRIRITAVDDTSRWDMSEPFSLQSIYSGSLTVTAPAKGAQISMDSTFAIRWDATGNIGSYLGLQLYKDTILLSTLTTSALPSGFYSWTTIKSALASYGSGDDYHIRVFSIGNPSISATTASFSIHSSFTGGYSVLNPKSGDTLTAGELTSVSWSADGNPGNGVRLTLWRDSIQTSTLTSSSSNSGNISFTPNPSLITSNRYRIRVASQSDPSIYAFSGYFRIEGMEADAFENDDSLQLAKSISVDGKPQQRTLTASDIDWVEFKATLGNRYFVNAKSSVMSMSVYLYDSAGRVLLSASALANTNLLFAPTRTGRYFTRITPYSGNGPYSLSIAEYDSSSSNEIQFLNPKSGSTWAAGTAYSIQYTPDSTFFGSYVNLALYQDTVFVQTIATSLVNGGNYTWSIPSSLFTSDRYRIRISNYSSSSIYSYSPYFTISGAMPDAYESDNTMASAKPIEIDSAPQPHTMATGDIDYIRFDAKTSKRYIATVKTTSGSIYGYILDGTGSQRTSQSGSQFSMVFIPTSNGTHYLRFNPYTSASVSYTVSLTEVDSTSSGFPVTFVAPDSSTTWASGSYYPMSWSADAALFGTTITLALYQDNLFVRSITTGISNTGTYSWTIPVGLTTSSRYRIRISNYSNSTIWGQSEPFTISGISPDAFEPDNSRPEAKDITTDGIVQKRNIVLSDTDWVAFDAATGQSYLIMVNAATSVYLYLADSLGTQLQYSSGINPSLVLKPARAGKYFARIQYYSGTGAYNLSVLKFSADGEGIDAKFTSPIESTTWATLTSYTATWTPDSTLFGATIGLALYRDSLMIQSLTLGSTNTGKYSISLQAGIATSSRYRLRLSNYAHPEIFGYSPYFSVSGTPLDSLEPNDSVGMAKEITPNSGRLGLSLNYRDRDIFKFTAKAKMLYVVQTITPTNLYTTTRLMNVTGTTTLMTVSKSTTLDSVTTLSWVCPTDGIYTISIDPTSTSYYGNYGLELKEVEPASYPFSVTSPATAASVKSGLTQLVTWTDPAAIKGYVDIFLYNTGGVVQTIVANTLNSGSYNWIVPATLPAGTDYSIKIISRSSDAINGTSGVFSIAP